MLALLSIVACGAILRPNAIFDIADMHHLFPAARCVSLSTDVQYVGTVMPVPKMPSKVLVTAGKTGTHLMPLHRNEITCVYWSCFNGPPTLYDEKVSVLRNTRQWYRRITSYDAELQANFADAEDYIAWMSTIESVP